MKAIFFKRKVQLGVHATDTVRDECYYIEEKDVVLYKSAQNYLPLQYGINVNKEFINEIKNHFEFIKEGFRNPEKESAYIYFIQELEVEITAEEIDDLIEKKSIIEEMTNVVNEKVKSIF